ncbi:hypothetical protein [Streptococcus dentiloxodontae]
MQEENKQSLSSENKEGRKKRNRHLVKRIILGLLFFFSSVCCFSMIAGVVSHRFVMENILAIIGFIFSFFLLIVFERWILQMEQKINSKKILFLPILLIISIFIVTFALMAYQVNKSSPYAALGKNVNTSGYNHDFTDFGSDDLEKLIQKSLVKSKDKPIARIDLKDYHEVFVSTGNEITAYEFAEQDHRYFYLGMRDLLYHADWYPSASYNGQETVFCDASQSRSSHGIRMFQEGDSDPAWGVTEFNPEKAIKIKDKYPDQVEKIKIGSDSVIYLWIYYNLDNTEKLKLKDVEVVEP